MNKIKNLEKLIKDSRKLILEMTTKAGSGHPSSSLSCLEFMILLVCGEDRDLFDCDWGDFKNPRNDKLIFSKGHASPLFYILFYNLGLISKTELFSYRQFNSRLEGHPTVRFPYTVAPTGSLGMGLGIGLGVAIGQKMQKMGAKTFVLLGDSELAEGSNWEAIMLASVMKIENLIGIIDVNRLGQRGETMDGWNLETLKLKFISFGWDVLLVENGNNLEDLKKAVVKIKKMFENSEKSTEENKKPIVIILKTKKGNGVKIMENSPNWHGKILTKDQLEETLREL